MNFKIKVDNPNGSHSDLLVKQAFPRAFGGFMWGWEELGTIKYLEDDCMDRVEGFIIDTLGEPDDFSAEITEERKKYWKPESVIDRTEQIVNQYF